MNRCPKIFIISSVFLFLLVFFATPFLYPAFALDQSGTLYNLSDTLNDATYFAPAVHSVTFTLPGTSEQIIASDYIQIDLPFFSFPTVPTRVIGTYTGTPSYSVSGNTVRITGINVLPAKTITIEGFEAQNPGTSPEFTFTVSVTQDEEGLLIKNFARAMASEHTGSITVSATVDIPQARLDIQGYTSPLGYLIFTEGETIMGTQVSNSLGYFNKIFTSLPPGDHTISFYTIDTENRTSSIRSIDVNTPVYLTTTVTDQLLSPTIEIDSSTYVQANSLTASGSAYPGTAITLFTDSPVQTYSASASATGDWSYSIATLSAYTPGDYRIYALAQTGGGLQSLISPTILFTISGSGSGGSGTSCGDISDGDLNCDDDVNLTDFSILMYYWGSTDAAADIDASQLVDLTDFSIMMYWWGS